MKIGLSLPQAGINATKNNILKLCQYAERESIESLWVFERLLWPINPKSQYPASPDGMMPKEWQNVLDPLSLLAFAAANTKNALLGTAVIDAPFHNPVVLGKEFATIDVLSEGRLIAGLGLGWSKDEYETSNVSFENKGKRQDEFLEAMKRVWTQDTVEFKGKFYTISPSKIGPKPIQKPHPKILLGGFSPNTFERIARFGDGWIGAAMGQIDQLGNIISMIRDIASKAGRDPKRLDMSTLVFPYLTEKPLGEKRNPMSGSIEEIISDVARMQDIGFNRIIFLTPAGENYSVEKTISLAKRLSESI